MTECAEAGCDKTPTTLIPIPTHPSSGVLARMRPFCDDHKPLGGMIVQSESRIRSVHVVKAEDAFSPECQLTIDDALADVIPSRSTDPETSHAAAREIRVKAGTQRAYLLQAFAWADQRNRYGGALTDEQAMGLHPEIFPTSEYAKRCSELREGGFIEATGETRAGSAGPQRIVSRITDKGRAWIEANR